MSHLNPFTDKCTIHRHTGETDEWENDIFSVVYKGQCLIEGSKSEDKGKREWECKVFIPKLALIHLGDFVEMTDWSGNITKGSVTEFRHVNLMFSGRTITELVVTNVTEDGK